MEGEEKLKLELKRSGQQLGGPEGSSGRRRPTEATSQQSKVQQSMYTWELGYITTIKCTGTGNYSVKNKFKSYNY